MAADQDLTMDTPESMDIYDIMGFGGELHAGNGFVLPVSEMSEMNLNEFYKQAEGIQKAHNDWESSSFTGVTVTGANSAHGRFIAKQHFNGFNETRISTGELGGQTDHRDNYLTLFVAEHEYKKGNEHDLKLYCEADGCEVTDAMTIKGFLADLAIKHCVKTVEEQKTKIDELEDENVLLKAKLKQFEEMQAKDSEPARPGKRARLTRG